MKKGIDNQGLRLHNKYVCTCTQHLDESIHRGSRPSQGAYSEGMAVAVDVVQSTMNISEFAEKIGVSRATVWRAIYDQGRISAETRDWVLEKAEVLGLKPSRAARALKTGRTQLVELWIPNLTRPFSGHILAHVQSQLTAKEADMLVRAVGSLSASVPQLLRTSLWPVDGIIAVDPPEAAIRFYYESVGQTTPFVNMGCYYCENLDFVGLDVYAGATQAAKHLITDCGCRSMVYLVDEFSARVGDARYDAVTQVTHQAGVPLDILTTKDATSASALYRMTAHLEQGKRFDGLFCYNDLLAIGAQQALARAGGRVLDDVALVGFDGIEVTEFLQVPLTTVQLPILRMCAVALEFLENRIADPSIPLQRSILKPKLAIRDSTQRC